MTIETALTPGTTTPPPAERPFGTWLRQHWPVVAGLLAMTVASIASLARQTWATEAGAHGPIVLATGLWLLHHDGLRLRDAKGGQPLWPTLLLLAVALPVYVFARAYDFIAPEIAALYLVFIAMLLWWFGWRKLSQHAFPLAYLAFVIPLPGWLMDTLTIGLKSWVSDAATAVTRLLGYPVEQQGVTLFVGPYQLLVEDACSGMNSLTGLLAVSLFYIYLMHRASWRYALLLALIAIPVAIFINFLRVLALILITYHFGDAVGQGFIHATTGVLLFGMAVAMIFAIDTLLRRFTRLGA